MGPGEADRALEQADLVGTSCWGQRREFPYQLAHMWDRRGSESGEV